MLPLLTGREHSQITAVLLEGGISCKQARRILMEKKFIETVGKLSRFRRSGVCDIQNINEIHSLAFKITNETKLSIFQFKIVHNILPHRAVDCSN